MSNRKYIWIVVLGILGLLIVLFAMFSPFEKRFDWSDTTRKQAYSETSEQPYGAKVFFQTLKSYFPGKRVALLDKKLENSLPKEVNAPASYVFIGGGMFLDSLDIQALLHFVERGNTALIISRSVPTEFAGMLSDSFCDAEAWTNYRMLTFAQADLRFLEPMQPDRSGAYTIQYYIKNEPQDYTWSFIDNRHFCDELPHAPLGSMNDSLVNFAWFPYGKGQVLLHTTPLAFTNYQLLKPNAREYTEAVLAYLPEGPIFWDGYSRTSAHIRTTANVSEEHPLSYILQQPALAWAWYLVIATGFLYVMFRAKRRQRVIPVLPKNENSSYEFISTIANLHFQQKDYRNMCVQGMKLFLAHIREKYGMTVAPMSPNSELLRIDDAFLQRLARVSEVPESQIRNIFIHYTNCIQYEPTEEMLVQLHLAIEAFEKKAKAF